MNCKVQYWTFNCTYLPNINSCSPRELDRNGFGQNYA